MIATVHRTYPTGGVSLNMFLAGRNPNGEYHERASQPQAEQNGRKIEWWRDKMGGFGGMARVAEEHEISGVVVVGPS